MQVGEADREPSEEALAERLVVDLERSRAELPTQAPVLALQGDKPRGVVSLTRRQVLAARVGDEFHRPAWREQQRERVADVHAQEAPHGRRQREHEAPAVSMQTLPLLAQDAGQEVGDPGRLVRVCLVVSHHRQRSRPGAVHGE